MTKPCPFCAEVIQAAAVKCKHCGTLLDGSVPLPLTPRVRPAPPPPPGSPVRRRLRRIQAAAIVLTVGGVAAAAFIGYRLHVEQANLTATLAAAQGGRCQEADADAAALFRPDDRATAARARLACDDAALDRALRGGDCDGAADRVDALAAKYVAPAASVAHPIAASLAVCLEREARAVAAEARCPEAQAAVDRARAQLGADAPASLAEIAATCQAAVAARAAAARVERVKALLENILVQGTTAAGATLLLSPADFTHLADDLQIDQAAVAAIDDPFERQRRQAEEQARHDAAVRTTYLAAVDKSYPSYDAGSKTLVFDGFRYQQGQTYYHFSFKTIEPAAALFPAAPSLALHGEQTSQIAQLALAPDLAKADYDALESGQDKLAVAFVPGKLEDSPLWADRTVTIASLKGAWLLDLARGAVTPLTIGPAPGTGGGGEDDQDPFAGP